MLFYADDASQLARPEELARLSGLDFLQGIVDGRYPQPPICRTLSFALVEVSEGRVVFEGTPRFEQYNPLGGVHGGWFGTLLDSCMSCAVQTELPVGKFYTTLEYRVNMTRPLGESSEKVRATGLTLQVGGRVGTAEGKITGVDSGKLYAFGTATCLIMSA